jgi:hypothetical protein
MQVAAVVSLAMGLAFLQACTIVNPYIAQPKAYGTFQAAMDDLQQVQNDLDNAVKSQYIIGAVSGLGTFLGFSGAGISAIFHASYASIVGFASGGAASFAFNGLYGNRTQTAIYNAGLDALSCINEAITPLVQHDIALKSARAQIRGNMRYIELQLQKLQCQCPNTTSILTEAVNTEKRIAEKLANEDSYAMAITSAIRSVVASVNKQLTTVVPDAVALARAGTSLGGQIVAGIPPAAPRVAEPQPHLAVPPPCCNDDLLQLYMSNLRVSINDASKIIETNVSFPPIACKVADAPTIAPISVVLPADASGNAATGITYRTGQTLGYTINGGTPPYMSIQWVGSTPQCFTAVIHSPNVLVLAPVAGADCSAGQTFSFDIYDALGQHLAKTLTITTP